MQWGQSSLTLTHLPFLVIIISVPTELNCFHKCAFSSSTLTSLVGDLAAGLLGMAGGGSSLWGRALAAMSEAEGNV